MQTRKPQQWKPTKKTFCRFACRSAAPHHRRSAAAGAVCRLHKRSNLSRRGARHVAGAPRVAPDAPSRRLADAPARARRRKHASCTPTGAPTRRRALRPARRVFGGRRVALARGEAQGSAHAATKGVLPARSIRRGLRTPCAPHTPRRADPHAPRTRHRACNTHTRVSAPAAWWSAPTPAVCAPAPAPPKLKPPKAGAPPAAAANPPPPPNAAPPKVNGDGAAAGGEPASFFSSLMARGGCLGAGARARCLDNIASTAQQAAPSSLPGSRKCKIPREPPAPRRRAPFKPSRALGHSGPPAAASLKPSVKTFLPDGK